MTKTRIAVAGAGTIGLAHMGVAQESPTCALAAVVDPSPAAAGPPRRRACRCTSRSTSCSARNRTFMLSDTAACPRSWEQTSQENEAYASYPDEDCYVVAGTLGSLSIPTMRLKTYSRAEDRSWWKPFEVGVVGMVRDDPLKHQMEHFGAVVRGEAPPLVAARDGLANLRVTEAIVEAAKTGRVVDIGTA